MTVGEYVDGGGRKGNAAGAVGAVLAFSLAFLSLGVMLQNGVFRSWERVISPLISPFMGGGIDVGAFGVWLAALGVAMAALSVIMWLVMAVERRRFGYVPSASEVKRRALAILASSGDGIIVNRETPVELVKLSVRRKGFGVYELRCGAVYLGHREYDWQRLGADAYERHMDRIIAYWAGALEREYERAERRAAR